MYQQYDSPLNLCPKDQGSVLVKEVVLNFKGSLVFVKGVQGVQERVELSLQCKGIVDVNPFVY